MTFLEDHGTLTPIVLTVPGVEHPGAHHWQSRWEAERADCTRVALGMWDRPIRNNWVTKLNSAIAQAQRPVILAAHGLGCLAVAWWAALERPAYGHPVAGALLVTPPDVDAANKDLRLVGFGPAPKVLLPFPSVVVASRNDPAMPIARAQSLAQFWGSHCVDAGEIGAADMASDLGEWAYGRHILSWLTSLALRGGPHASSVPVPAIAQEQPFTALRHPQPVRDLSL